MSPRVTLRLPSQLLDRLDELADAHHGGNRSAATRAALAAHLPPSGPSGEQSHARADGGSRPTVEVVGDWPTAEAVACVSDPVRTLSADGSGDTPGCELCGGEKPDGYYLELEYPPDSDADPGMLAGSVCGDCAGGWATNLLVERAHSRDIDIYDELL